MKYKLGLRLFLLLTSKTQNIWCVAGLSILCIVLQGLRREMNKFMQDRIYIYLSISIFLNQLWISKILPQILGLRISDMMLLRDRWKGEVNFFIRELWKSFSDFIIGLVTLLL